MISMGFVLFLFSVTILGFAVYILVSFLVSEQSIRRLDRESATWEPLSNLPSVSLILAARNEEASIEKATKSMLALDYHAMELIVVDDRSTDRTSEILHRLQADFPTKLRLVHIDELPTGWLGKCHALHVGAQQATGEWLLFTDADIHMRSDTLQAAINLANREHADHLTLAPFCEMPSWILRTFVATFAFLFKAFVKPHQIANPQSVAHVGIGAFNLVRRTVYVAIGGHESICLCPDDDMKLGLQIKKSGYPQRFANGLGLISVPWYSSLGELIKGLEKNCFAGIDYSYWTWIGSNIFVFGTAILPWLILPFADGWSQLMLGFACAIWLMMGACNAVRCGYRIDHGLALPIGLLLFLWTMNRSVILTLSRGGIYWRNTFYSLKELRAHRMKTNP